MMITKDAKIMGLIEGSDLQNMMQKHEMVNRVNVFKASFNLGYGKYAKRTCKGCRKSQIRT
jgi:hypothetical protein